MKKYLLKNTYAAIVALFIAMMALPTTAQAQTEYDLWICGTQVTSDNCGDLSGIDGVEGTVKYDQDSQTLTLEGATINSTTTNAIVLYMRDLTIKVIGTNSLTTTGDATLSFRGPLTLTGGGTLNVKSQTDCAVYANGTNLTINNCTVNAESGAYGIAGNGGSTEKLLIRNATVTAEGKDGSICDFKEITLEDCAITQPAGAKFDASLNGIVLNGKLVTSEVKIEPEYRKYDLHIGDTQVTSANCNDLSVIDGVEGKVSYDHSTKTLTLDNATIKNSSMYAAIDVDQPMDIKVKGVCKIESSAPGIYLREPTRIYSDRSSPDDQCLEVESGSEGTICMNKTHLIIDNCNVSAKNTYSKGIGISGEWTDYESTLTVQGDYARVTAEGKRASISNIVNLVLNGCAITQPTGATFDADQQAVVLNGEVVTSKVVIEKTPSAIGHVTTDALAAKQGIYTLSGVKLNGEVEDLPKGIYIVNGKKVVKK